LAFSHLFISLSSQRALLESEKSPQESDKEIGIVTQQPYATDKDGEDRISSDAQLGVQKIEATTSVRSTSHLVAA
jgi:hypothetical protein